MHGMLSKNQFYFYSRSHSSIKLAAYRDKIISLLKDKNEISLEARESLLRYRLENRISAYHHVNSLEAVGWSLDEYEASFVIIVCEFMMYAVHDRI